MKNIIILPIFFAILFFSACSSDIKDDASKTPIGSVISGETTSTDSYIEKVRQQNKSIDRDTWRPESKDRF